MATDKTKNKRGLLYVAGLILLGLAILGINQCSDSSAYTMNPEYYNVRVVIPIVLAVFIGFMVFLWTRDRKKKK